MNAKKKKIGFKLILFSLLFIPGMQTLFIVGCNSKYLLKLPIYIAVIVLNVLFIVQLIIGLKLFIDNKEANKRKLRKWLKVVFSIFMSVYVIGCTTLILLLYGPNPKFRTWLVTTAMSTMDHQYYCQIFFNDEQITKILSQNYILESGESTNTDLINQNSNEPVVYNEYEREIMMHEEGEPYKIVTFEVNGATAYLAAIYDPSKVELAVTEEIGVIGEYVTHMAERTGAIMALNAGGFVDQGNNLGESPTGITIVDNQIITNNEYGVATSTGGIIGMTNDNVLVLLKNKTAEEAIEMGVRDAVSWGPFLIVNGVPSTVSGNGGWGGGARSAIGQRKDGTILFLVVESNSIRTTGAGMEDLVKIMERYGAYNAANLDGGTSSVLAIKRDIAKSKYNASCHDFFTNYACPINDPIDATGTHQTRYVADAWIVMP